MCVCVGGGGGGGGRKLDQISRKVKSRIAIFFSRNQVNRVEAMHSSHMHSSRSHALVTQFTTRSLAFKCYQNFVS